MTEADRQKDRQGQTETETRTKQENESYESFLVNFFVVVMAQQY